jgi:hypothetical protein
MSKKPTLRNAHSTLGNIYNNPRVPESPPESHQNCERLQPGGLSPEIKVSTLCHLATSQAVVLQSEIKVTFDLPNFLFALSPSHIWVTNPYLQHGDTTTCRCLTDLCSLLCKGIEKLSYPIPNLTYSQCSLFIQTRLWGPNHGGITIPPFTEEML